MVRSPHETHRISQADGDISIFESSIPLSLFLPDVSHSWCWHLDHSSLHHHVWVDFITVFLFHMFFRELDVSLDSLIISDGFFPSFMIQPPILAPMNFSKLPAWHITWELQKIVVSPKSFPKSKMLISSMFKLSNFWKSHRTPMEKPIENRGFDASSSPPHSSKSLASASARQRSWCCRCSSLGDTGAEALKSQTMGAYPLVVSKQLLNIAIYSWITHTKWWFSIVMGDLLIMMGFGPPKYGGLNFEHFWTINDHQTRGVEEIQLGVLINRYQWTVLAVDNIEVNTLYITCPIGQYWRKFYIPPPSIIYDDLVERLLLFTQMVLDWLSFFIGKLSS